MRTFRIFTNSEILSFAFSLSFALLIFLLSIPSQQIESMAEYLTSRLQTARRPTVSLNRFCTFFTSLSKKLTAIKSPPFSLFCLSKCLRIKPLRLKSGHIGVTIKKPVSIGRRAYILAPMLLRVFSAKGWFLGEMCRCAFLYEVIRIRYICSVSMNRDGYMIKGQGGC